jgi:hypothetical protein
MIWMGVGAQDFLPSIGASNAAALTKTKGSFEQQVKAPVAQETADAR